MDRICLVLCERSCLRGFGRYRYRCRWRSIPRRLSLENISGIEGLFFCWVRTFRQTPVCILTCLTPLSLVPISNVLSDGDAHRVVILSICRVSLPLWIFRGMNLLSVGSKRTTLPFSVVAQI